MVKLLLQQPEGLSVGSYACGALGLEANSNVLYLAAQLGLDRTCDLLMEKGVRATEPPKTVGSQTLQENVRAVLEPHRWSILRWASRRCLCAL